MQSKYNL